MGDLPVVEVMGQRFLLIPETRYLELVHRAGQEAPLAPGLLDLEDLVDADSFMARSIGEDLKTARLAAGLTQAQLAARTRRSQALVSSSERGTIEVGIRYFRAVLKACGLPEDWNPRAPAAATAAAPPGGEAAQDNGPGPANGS
jgi:hypothetical protein